MPRVLPEIILIVLAVTIITSACGTDKPAQTPVSDTRVESTLLAALNAEFERLAIDPDKITSAVAGGAENAVFDLTAQYYPPGQAGSDSAHFALRWTERLVGDYDQNGEVNLADLSAMSPRLGQQVQYDPQVGDARRPVGDPDADGAANWRNARVDGDSNGEINIADVTPLASHWRHTLSGYRTYVKEPGQDAFHLLPDEQSPILLERPQPAPALAPVRYEFTMSAPTVDGTYTYRVVGYDASTGAEGLPSNEVSIHISGETVNVLPVVMLSADPPSGVDPQLLTLSAAGSYDPDGSVVSYQWDFEGDGVWDTEPISVSSIQREFEFPGEYRPLVGVVDDSAGSSFAQIDLSIRPSSWLRTWLPPTAFARINGMCCDQNGNIYIAGTAMTADPSDLSAMGGTLVAKYNAAGDVLWCRLLEGITSDAVALGVLVGGDLLLGAGIEQLVQVGPDTYTSIYDNVLARMSAQGSLKWAKRTDLDELDTVREIHAATDGSIYVLIRTGHFNWTDGLIEIPLVQRVSDDGDVLWQKGVEDVFFSWDGQTAVDKRYSLVDLAVSPAGNPVMLCSARDNNGDPAFALARLDNSGELAGIRVTAREIGQLEPKCVVIDPTGVAYVGSSYIGAYPVEIVAVSPSGDPLWGRGLQDVTYQFAQHSLQTFGTGLAVMTRYSLNALDSMGNPLWGVRPSVEGQDPGWDLFGTSSSRVYLGSEYDADDGIHLERFDTASLDFELTTEVVSDFELTSPEIPASIPIEIDFITLDPELAASHDLGHRTLLIANPQGPGYEVPQ